MTQPTNGKSHVHPRLLDPAQSPHVSTPFLNVRGIAEATTGRVARTLGRAATALQSLGARLHVQADLCLQLGAVVIAPEQVERSPKDFAEGDHGVRRVAG